MSLSAAVATFLRACTAALVAAVLPGHAEPPVADAPLWTGLPAAAANIDVDRALPGIELLSLAGACSAAPPDGAGFITVTRAHKIRIFSADGSQIVVAPGKPVQLTSGPFPDPRQARFQCGGSDVTHYTSRFPVTDASNLVTGYGIPVGPGGFRDACAPHTFEAQYAICDELPDHTLGLTVAKSGSQRVLLLGSAMNLNWHNNITDVNADASAYIVNAYSMIGSLLWSRAFTPLDDDGYQLIGHLARVGDFLGGDGNDEIRLMSEGEGGVRYTYVDPLNGLNIRVVTVKPPKPPVLP
ncbi:MAG: hypothetical protein ACOZJX_03840 [Pseudomonadota bacterium]